MQPANDNAKRKYVRGSFADAIPAILAFRNRPDSPPDPLRSSWTTDPSTVIPDGDFDGDDKPEKMAEDLLLEITPSLSQIMFQVKHGAVVKNERGQILSIGKLKFSYKNEHERVTCNGANGVETRMLKLPPGAMLGTTEKLGAAHGGSAPAVVTISNRNLTGRLMGWVLDEAGKETDVPNGWRAYIPGGIRRKGKNLTASQSRALIAEAIANTPKLPAVTVCAPGVASGTARYSDQFIGMKVGSAGKGGAPNWTDEFMAMRDHEEWQATVRAVEPKHLKVVEAAMVAQTFGEIGVAAGQAREYARRKGGKRALLAANDNFVTAMRKSAA